VIYYDKTYIWQIDAPEAAIVRGEEVAPEEAAPEAPAVVRGEEIVPEEVAPEAASVSKVANIVTCWHRDYIDFRLQFSVLG